MSFESGNRVRDGASGELRRIVCVGLAILSYYVYVYLI